MYQVVELKVPASTANLGPGFDCLGLALGIWNEVRLQVGVIGTMIEGEGAELLARDEQNIVRQAATRVFLEAGIPTPQFAILCRNLIPIGKGLGSSAAAVVGGLVAANAVCGHRLPQETLLRLATEMEGHPDNVTPALLGGCRIAVEQGDELISMIVPIPGDLRAVVFIPDQPMPTKQSRTVLPRSVGLKDVKFNLARTALLVNSFSTGQLNYLGIATEDRLHQPYREQLFPSMGLIIRAARRAGALGAFLSGSGSSILALTRGREMTIGYEMADIADKAGVRGTVRVVELVVEGAQITKLE